jgi:hypothetical protein
MKRNGSLFRRFSIFAVGPSQSLGKIAVHKEMTLVVLSVAGNFERHRPRLTLEEGEIE